MNLIHLTLRITLLFLFLFSSLLLAKDLKLGYIDSGKIFEKYKGTSDAQKKFNDLQLEWKNKAEKLQKEIMGLMEELENQSLLLSEEKKKEKQQIIIQKRAELEQYVSKVWGNSGQAYRRNAELTKPIMTKINAILKRIGEEENYSYIFDAAQGNIVFAAQGNDLTERIIEELNREAE